ncbi:MAG: selenocysteine-specific translation elongation factor [Acidobacteriota bacterium]
MEVIVGTAGHIDHGKTALIKALTGIDADRLPEEKRRGITVDIGFAEMSVGDAHFGFVDVPGHERFVKNMLAGASGIDLVMLVIAADEGVMPQTREHFDICRLLGINSGIVVLTKSDLVDAETMELAKLDAAELVAGSFLENAPVVSLSSRTGEGIETLKDTLVRVSNSFDRRDDKFVTRLPIDRSFTMKGFGAVVTGTLASGEIAEGAEMQLFPTGEKVRVRGIQMHGKPTTRVSAGSRVAVNLGGIDHSKVERGMTLVEPNALRSTHIFDALIEILSDAPKSLRTRQRVRVHIGTIEALARIQVLNNTGEIAPGDSGFAQIRLEVPVVMVPGERFIIRSYSPQSTTGGGAVIDNRAVKHRRKDLEAVCKYLSDLHSASDNHIAMVKLTVTAKGTLGLSFAALQARTALNKDNLMVAIERNLAAGEILDIDGHYLATGSFGSLSRAAVNAVEQFHQREPLAKGMSRQALREQVFWYLPDEVFQSVIASVGSSGKIELDRDVIRLRSHRAKLSPVEIVVSEKILTIFKTARLEVPKLDDALADAIAGTNLSRQDARKYFQQFLDTGEIVKVTDEFYFVRDSIDRLVEKLREVASNTPDRLIDVAKFKALAGISRKYAIPLLEYFDRERITTRAGDKRYVQNPAR